MARGLPLQGAGMAFRRPMERLRGTALLSVMLITKADSHKANLLEYRAI